MAKYNLTEKKQKTPLYRSLLKLETVDEVYQKIMAKFIVEKKYRDCNYSAKKMAEELNTNVRYISAIINMRYQDNYSQMVNEFRIKEAMYMLKDRRYLNMNIEDIALAVGFQNRQCFYVAFYKRVGITPREYRITNIEMLQEKLESKKKRRTASKKNQDK
ncbi:MAG: AraC family transcriptional regulator [Bacteroidaceae bacterium]|nr:AraC family transcriptional regulator [Bacteroidaceae bacterium]MBR6169542.1 AraC family transcriptional regulator [Bacteroidaceae bacterium]